MIAQKFAQYWPEVMCVLVLAVVLAFAASSGPDGSGGG
jgi:hypothetical protein